MGKKRAAVIGSAEEEQIKAKKSVKREQKKLRSAKVPGMGGGQRVIDTTEESLREFEEIQKRTAVPQSPQLSQSPQTPKRTHTRSKPYLAAKSQTDPEKTYSLSDGLTLLRKVSLTKFDPTVELHFTLKNPAKNKLSVNLPHVFGKTRKIAVADDATLAKIESGQIDFDILVASPDQMGKLVKYAKILGPRGLMPNPKNGTVTPNPEDTAKKLSQDTSTFLTPDRGNNQVVHTAIGKLSFTDKKLSQNISAVVSVFPGLTKKIVLKSTMSPAIKISV